MDLEIFILFHIIISFVNFLLKIKLTHKNPCYFVSREKQNMDIKRGERITITIQISEANKRENKRVPTLFFSSETIHIHVTYMKKKKKKKQKLNFLILDF